MLSDLLQDNAQSVKQCHSEIYISSTSCKYELKLWIWNFPIDHYHYRFVLSDQTTEKNGWLEKNDVRKTEIGSRPLLIQVTKGYHATRYLGPCISVLHCK